MSAKIIAGTAAAAMLVAAMPAVAGDAKSISGRRVFETVCISCHGTGKDGAPRFGSQADWAPRAAKGLDKLAQNAVEGVRKMPAHGGQPSLNDLEMSRAIAFMVSNGTSTDPAKPYAIPRRKQGEEIVRDTCSGCHGDGKNGSPRIGDVAAWTPRLSDGLDRVVNSALRGHKNMPARGGMAGYGDADIRAAVYAMINETMVHGAK